MSPPSINTRLTALARLLEYPRCELAALCQDAATTGLEQFVSAVSALSSDEREELYTATFDVMPSCVPYVSVHLFGEENFKRGEFMAALQARYQQAGFNTGGELPDHLSLLLRFTAETDESERSELVEFCLLGPVKTMVGVLAATNPYRYLLEAILDILREAYPGMQPAPNPANEMRQHRSDCAPLSACFHCGAAQAQDGSEDHGEKTSPTNPVSLDYAATATR
jgi:nitrate reductase delta subunit